MVTLITISVFGGHSRNFKLLHPANIGSLYVNLAFFQPLDVIKRATLYQIGEI
jgi:hypothetical protein